MASDFHERLIQARRDGVALPQVEQGAAPEFDPIEDYSYPVVCGSCGAVVVNEGTHAEFHTSLAEAGIPFI